MPRRRRTDHIILGGAVGEIGWCTRCGEGLRLPMPIRVEVMLGAMDGFTKAHRDCQDRGRVEPDPKTPEEWIASRDVGVSSATIWSVMTGQPSPFNRYGVPVDGADYGRCYRLLARFPAWRARLGEVADKFPEWRSVVAYWDERASQHQPDPTSPFRLTSIQLG